MMKITVEWPEEVKGEHFILMNIGKCKNLSQYYLVTLCQTVGRYCQSNTKLILSNTVMAR